MEPTPGSWDAWDEIYAVYPSEDTANGPPYAARAFHDTNTYYGPVLQGMVPDPDSPGSTRGERCSDIDSPPCDTADSIHVSGILPACSDTRPVDCVESLFARVGEEEVVGRPIGEWLDTDDAQFPEIPVINGPPIPASGRTSIWSLPGVPHPGGTSYLASVNVFSMLDRSSGGLAKESLELSAEILAVTPTTWTPWDVINCKGVRNWQTGDCLETQMMPDVPFGIRVRVGPSFGAFVFGRVIEPRINIQSAGQGIVLEVEGRPAVTPQAVVAVPAAQAPPYSYPPKKGVELSYMDAGQEYSLQSWRDWAVLIGPRSDALKRIWSFRSSNKAFRGVERCLPAGQVSGWISTNAMVYEATPPAYSASSGAMDFQIGGPALQPNGALASADYEFFLRKSVADCIWGGQNVTAVATVSVLDGAQGEEVTTTSVGASGDWVKFIARNVLFPDVTSAQGLARSGQGITPTVRVTVPPKQTAPTFPTCVAMRQRYKDGVSAKGAVNVVVVKGKRIAKPALGKPFVSDALYTAHAKLDSDKDRLVCEREPKVKR